MGNENLEVGPITELWGILRRELAHNMDPTLRRPTHMKHLGKFRHTRRSSRSLSRWTRRRSCALQHMTMERT